MVVTIPYKPWSTRVLIGSDQLAPSTQAIPGVPSSSLFMAWSIRCCFGLADMGTATVVCLRRMAPCQKMGGPQTGGFPFGFPLRPQKRVLSKRDTPTHTHTRTNTHTHIVRCVRVPTYLLIRRLFEALAPFDELNS